MPENYAHAVIRLASGQDARSAVKKLHAALAARGREKILPRIARALHRELHRVAHQDAAQVSVAKKEDVKNVPVEAQTPAPAVLIDPTLIGGYRLRRKDVLIDASYKKQLQELYYRATKN